MSNSLHGEPLEVMFEEFPSLARLSKDMVVSEKIDGTNAQILILDDGQVLAGSRTRMITPESDNFGFARWVREHEDELRTKLGVGRHYGEWWGPGIQRGYDIKRKKFSLFRADLWTEHRDTLPQDVDVVPILYQGPFSTQVIDEIMEKLWNEGSVAAPGFRKPEGVVVFHTAAQVSFKKTFDDRHKWEAAVGKR